MSDMNTVNTGAAAPQDERTATDLRESLIDLIAESLSGTFHCGRVWAAWGVGTMSEDDFHDVGESDTPTELADSIIAMLNERAALPAQAVAPVKTSAQHAAVRKVLLHHGLTKHGDGVIEADLIYAVLSALAAPAQDAAPTDTANGIAWQSTGLGITRTAVMVDGRSWYRDDDPRVTASPSAVAKDVAPSDARPEGVHANPTQAKCPITGLPYFMTLEHPTLGMVETFGGPFDSYTVPAPDGEPTNPWHERELHCERFDHDAGHWTDGGSPVPLRIIHEDVLFALEEKAEAASAAMLAGQHPIPQSLRDAFNRIEDSSPAASGMQVFTQMRTAAQAYFQSQPAAQPADAGGDGLTIRFRTTASELPHLRHHSTSYAGQWASDWCVAINEAGRVMDTRFTVSESVKAAIDQGRRPIIPWAFELWGAPVVAWIYASELKNEVTALFQRDSMARTQEGAAS